MPGTTTHEDRIWRSRPGPPPPRDAPIRRASSLGRPDLGGISLLWLVAVLLRVPGLSDHGLYRDDAWPALATEVGLGRAMRIGVTTPGFEAFLKAWIGMSRASWWAQMPALMASTATVVAVYVLVRRIGCGRIAALAAGGALALSPVSVLYATRVKPYSFDALSTVVVITTALALSRQPSSWRRWALLLVVALGAAFFSASTLPVTVAAMAWSALLTLLQSWHDRRARRLAVAVPIAFFALVAAYSRVVLASVPPSLHESWQTNFIFASSYDELARTTTGVLDSFMAGIFYRHGPTGPAAFLVLALLALWCRPRAASLVVAPVLVAVALALAQRVPFGGGRIDLYLYPCVALMVAMSVQKVLDLGVGRLLPARLVEVALAVAIVGFAVTGGRYHVQANRYPAADMGSLRAAVAARMEPGDAVVVAPFSRYPFALYGARRPELVFDTRYAPGFTVTSGDPDILIMPAEYFEGGYDPDDAVRFARGRSRVWYLATDTPMSDTPPDVQANEYVPEQRLLADGFMFMERVDAYGVHADLLIRP